MKNNPTDEQRRILESDKKNLIVSASAGSGKTFVVIEYLISLICDKKLPVSKLLVLTFTKAAANEMKSRLNKAILEQKSTPFLLEQLDEIPISDISTIDSFCEKLIKRHSNLLGIDEDFKVLDQAASQNLKRTAFMRAMAEFEKAQPSDFDKVFFAFKHNNQMLFDCMCEIMSFFDSSCESAEDFLKRAPVFAENAEKYLLKTFSDKLAQAKQLLCQVGSDLPKPYEDFSSALYDVATMKLPGDFFKAVDLLSKAVLPRTPGSKIDNVQAKAVLVNAKDKIKQAIQLAQTFEGENRGLCEIGSQLLKLQIFFEKQYASLKKDGDFVDFADLEKMVKKLIENQEVLSFLQEKYAYIFIDEYQDTNTLQSAIVKPIAAQGNFVAVGDPKQGIYAFRNASMEIMQQDIEDFTNADDSDALYLTGNFRSDKRVLDFVNDVFKKLMTPQSVGIDYQKTAMLSGMTSFEKPAQPSVSVDIVCPQNQEQPQVAGLYSVMKDDFKQTSKYSLEVATIKARINQLLSSVIYDGKQKRFRPVREGDIALLFRSRGQLMQECVRDLQDSGFNVIADIKQSLLDDREVAVLVSLLRLTLNRNDDISLAAVLNSWVGGYSLDQLAEIRLSGDKDLTFAQLFAQQTDEKAQQFENLLQLLSFEIQTMGLTKAIQRLFDRKNYYAYQSSLPDSSMKKQTMLQFFKQLRAGENDFNLPAFLDHLDNDGDTTSAVQPSADAITVTTIHATKGLEYPIVLLAGGGESLAKPYNRSYIISHEFGLATQLYDFDRDLRLPSPSFTATRLYKAKSEWVSEIMIFYVAMTRAQNHLFVTGTVSEKFFTEQRELDDCDTYLDLIFYALGQDLKEQIFQQGSISTENRRYTFVDSVDSQNTAAALLQSSNFDQNIDEVKKYIDFQYKNADICKINLKNSVTSLLNLDNDDDGGLAFSSDVARSQAIERGNAFHSALRYIDFNSVDSESELKEKLQDIKCLLGEEFDLIDSEILFKNIQLLKSVIGNNKVMKERQFIMNCSLREAGQGDSDEKVIVQGVVDLFAYGEKNILIDYKFTSNNNDESVKKHYQKQLQLYSLALEKAFDIKIDEIYLLSLKYARLLRVK